MIRKLVVSIVLVFGSAAPFVACGSSSEKDPASGTWSLQCNACFDKVYTKEQCEAFGEDNGCASAVLAGDVVNCHNGCKFTQCQEEPDCEALESEASGPDGSGGMPAEDPACAEGSGDGFFPTCDVCPDNCGTVTINGNTRHTCNCDAGCPCGFECGSIPLEVGGTLGGVCAPPED
jgi:hypothetical protein